MYLKIVCSEGKEEFQEEKNNKMKYYLREHEEQANIFNIANTFSNILNSEFLEKKM